MSEIGIVKDRPNGAFLTFRFSSENSTSVVEKRAFKEDDKKILDNQSRNIENGMVTNNIQRSSAFFKDTAIIKIPIATQITPASGRTSDTPFLALGVNLVMILPND